MNFSRPGQHPLPQSYQGDDPRELAYQCFVDWDELHRSGDLAEYAGVLQAVNHASHWLKVDTADHLKLEATITAIKQANQAKAKWFAVKQIFSRMGYSSDIQRLTSVAFPHYDGVLETLKASLFSIRGKVYSTIVNRHYDPFVKQIYSQLLGPETLIDALDPASHIDLAYLHIHTSTLEKLSCAMYLAVDAEMKTYHANMGRLLRDFRPKLIALMEAYVHPEWPQSLRDLMRAYWSIVRLVAGPDVNEVDVGMLSSNIINNTDGDHGDKDVYLGQIVRYWSRWDRKGTAQDRFKEAWSLVAERRCVVWQR